MFDVSKSALKRIIEVSSKKKKSFLESLLMVEVVRVSLTNLILTIKLVKMIKS